MKLLIILALSVSAAALGQPNGGGVFPPPVKPGCTGSRTASCTPQLDASGSFSVGSGVSLGIANIFGASNTLHGLYINQTGGAGADVRALNVYANGPTTALGQFVIDCATCTTGGVGWVGTGSAAFSNTTTGAMYVTVSNAAATGHGLMVRNAGLGYASHLKNDQNTTLMYLDGANTTTSGITGAFGALTTGGGVDIGSNNSGFTGNGLIRANVGHASASGSAIYGVTAGTGAAGRFDSSKGYGIDIQPSSTTTAGQRIFMTAQNNNTGLKIQSYNAPTGTGTALEVWGGTNGATLGFSVAPDGSTVIPSLKATSGTRFICVDTDGKLVSQTTACSGT